MRAERTVLDRAKVRKMTEHRRKSEDARIVNLSIDATCSPARLKFSLLCMSDTASPVAIDAIRVEGADMQLISESFSAPFGEEVPYDVELEEPAESGMTFTVVVSYSGGQYERVAFVN